MTTDPTTLSHQLAAAGRVARHTHAEADVASLVTDLAGKAAASHSHAEADVTNLTSDLAGKSATGHTHTEADVTSLTADLAALPKGTLYAPTHSTATTTLSTTLGTYTTVYTAPSATYKAGRRYNLRFFGAYVQSSVNGGNNAYDVTIMNGATELGGQTTGLNATGTAYAAATAEADWLPGSDVTVALTVQVAQTVGTVTAASTVHSGTGGYMTLLAVDMGAV